MRTGSRRRLKQQMLKQRADSCRKKHPDYSRLGRLVNQTLNSSPTSPSSSRRSPKSSKRHSSHEDDVEEEEDDVSISPSRQPLKRRKRDSEERLQRIDSEGSSSSSSDSESDTPSSSVLISEDGIYGEELNPMRKRYLAESSIQTDKNIESTTNKTDNKINVMSLSKGEEEGEGLGAGGVKKGLEEGNQKPSNITTSGEVNGRNGPMFKDLGGMRSEIEELEEEVCFPMYNLHVFRSLGVDPVTGILLYGPPGCGKTTLAHAIANETGVPFYKISGTDVVSGISGASEEYIRELFAKAYRTAPSIIFIDEIDAIASKREGLQKEMERRIVTQLMICMDEYHRLLQPDDPKSISDENPGYVLVIGATNRPDALDPALRRPGRFDFEIRLGVPDEKARIEILKVLTEKPTLEGSVDLQQIARSTSGFVGTDLKALVNKAGKYALRRFRARRKSNLTREYTEKERVEPWWKIRCLLEETEKELAIRMTDFEQAAKVVQPSLRREGFSSVPNVKWEHIGGLADIRNEFELQIVSRIKHPEDYQKFGLNLDTGILLYGPPGCGKTLIAMAVANEAGANFIHIKGPELLNKYVGESEAAIRTLFDRARTCSPCVLFFDEVDAVTRNTGREGVHETLLKQLLIELDGGSTRQDVFVIGATNRPEVMDPAMLRPGRFGELLYVPLPSADERGMILKALVKGKPIDTSVDLSAIGRMEACSNFSGADLKKLVNKAAMAAILESRMNQSSLYTITAAHFVEALKKISPSISIKQIQYYEDLSRRFKSG